MADQLGDENMPGGRTVPEGEERRAVLTKIGRFAYVAPAMVLLTEPSYAARYGRPGPKPPKRPK